MPDEASTKVSTEIIISWELGPDLATLPFSSTVIFSLKLIWKGVSLVSQWLRICLGKQETPGRSHMPRRNQALEPQLLSSCSTTREATTVRRLHTTTREETLLEATAESSCAAMKTQHSQKKVSTCFQKFVLKDNWREIYSKIPLVDLGKLPENTGLGTTLLPVRHRA